MSQLKQSENFISIHVVLGSPRWFLYFKILFWEKVHTHHMAKEACDTKWSKTDTELTIDTCVKKVFMTSSKW